MGMSALCKICIYYNSTEKTCVRSIVAVSPGKVHHDYAKFVRLDKKRCGPNGSWFASKGDVSPIDELFESFDI